MLERDLLNSFKRMLDSVKGDHKISSDAALVEYLSKKSKDIIAPSYEDAVRDDLNGEESKTSTPTRGCPPLSQTKEVRTEMTAALFDKVLKSTAKAKYIDPTQELILQGKQADVGSPKSPPVTSTSIKKLKSSCPSMKTCQLQQFNLHAKQKSRRVRLVDFPANIERVSVRGSYFEPRTFFSRKRSEIGSKEKTLERLRVLDVGRALFVEEKHEGRTQAPEDCWPEIASLEELFLEGAPQLASPTFLAAILTKFPNLKVLDLEGTAVSGADLLTIGRLAPNLRELYLGFTSMTDAAMVALEQSRAAGEGLFDKLETMCLCETEVTDLGLASVVAACPSLRTVTVRRSKVSERAATLAKQAIPGLSVARVENTHIYTVFRNQGCDHFIRRHDLAS